MNIMGEICEGLEGSKKYTGDNYSIASSEGAYSYNAKLNAIVYAGPNGAGKIDLTEEDKKCLEEKGFKSLVDDLKLDKRL